ncbi:MAG: response regulator [Candidatus Pacebacteria bacterium]|nr:response regulator [Candidatus Paceibacterota bacterium]
MKTLMIDDCSARMKIMFRTFTDMFFAENEEEGLTILKEQNIDVILMDDNLCTDRTGIDIVKDLRLSGNKARIIMFSSDDKRNDYGILAGADDKWNKKDLGKEGWKNDLLAKIEG